MFADILILLLGMGFAARGFARIKGGAWSGPRSTAMRQRSAGGQKQRSVRQEIRLLRERARIADWGRQRDHDRKHATATVTRLGDRHAASTPRRPAPRTSGQDGAGPQAWTPSPVRHEAPSPNGSPGRTHTVAAGTSTAAAEKLIEGISQIHQQAASGNIHAKHAAIKSCNEAALRFSAMAAMLSRQMSEPGMHYGPEITEPLEKASTHLQASGMAFAESDAALTTLLSMTVGDLAASGRQAPHHAELTESGNY